MGGANGSARAAAIIHDNGAAQRFLQNFGLQAP
jgi:hypothetical protein